MVASSKLLSSLQIRKKHSNFTKTSQRFRFLADVHRKLVLAGLHNADVFTI